MFRVVFCSLFFISWITAASAKPSDAAISTLDLRIQRLENTLSSGGLLDLFEQIEQLRTQVTNLQGELDLQNHKLGKLEAQHDKAVSDLNNRIQQLESTIQSLQHSKNGSSDSTDADDLESEPTTENNNFENNNEGSADSEAIQTEDNETIKQTYQDAFNLLRASEYDEASTAFLEFISLYPKSAYADNAQYWLAESYYVQSDFDNAVLAYQGLIDNYPESSKVSHAALKLAYSYQELDQIDNAIQTLNSIINNYPGSSIAEEANKRLGSLSASSSE